MEKINITDIEEASVFIKYVTSFDLVEAVYLVQRITGNKLMLDVVVVVNLSLNYRDKMKLTDNEKRNQREHIRGFIEDIKDEESRVKYLFTDSGDYCSMLMHNREIRAAKDLVSSTIIFDRFNKFRELKDELKFKYNIEPFTNSFPVDGDIILFMEKKGFSRNLNI